MLNYSNEICLRGKKHFFLLSSVLFLSGSFSNCMKRKQRKAENSINAESPKNAFSADTVNFTEITRLKKNKINPNFHGNMFKFVLGGGPRLSAGEEIISFDNTNKLKNKGAMPKEYTLVKESLKSLEKICRNSNPGKEVSSLKFNLNDLVKTVDLAKTLDEYFARAREAEVIRYKNMILNGWAKEINNGSSFLPGISAFLRK